LTPLLPHEPIVAEPGINALIELLDQHRPALHSHLHGLRQDGAIFPHGSEGHEGGELLDLHSDHRRKGFAAAHLDRLDKGPALGDGQLAIDMLVESISLVVIFQGRLETKDQVARTLLQQNQAIG
jgi:hypothetical protein